MFVFGFVVLFVGLQVISAQPPPHENLPPQCRGPPPGVERPHECCKIPPFFEPKDFEECGFKKPQEGESYQRPPGPPGPPGPRGPPGPPDCSRQQCLMDKYGLSKDGEIDYEAVSAYMDQYAEKNEAFKPAIDVAKERCVGKDLPGPPHICEGNKLVGCLSSTIFLECPAWEESDNCKTLKDHLEQCKPFFHKS